METLDDLMVNHQAGIMQLGCRPPISIFGMAFRNIHERHPQITILLIIRLSETEGIPTALGQTQRSQDRVESIGLFMGIGQDYFVLSGEVPVKKFLRSAISTSLWPIKRSKSAIFFSYS